MRLLAPPFVAAALWLSGTAVACRGEEAAPAAPSLEAYAGFDYGGRSASLTTSAVWSPFVPVDQPGLRFKLDGLANIYGGTNASVFSNGFTAAGLKSFGDIMCGIQLNYGPVWLKLYGGAGYEVEAMLFSQAGRAVQRQAWGGAAAAEFYWRIGDRVWTSGAASWLQPDGTVSLYSRAAYEFYRDGADLRVSAGSETGFAAGNANEFSLGRALNRYNGFSRGGALINLRYGAHDITLSGGMARASDERAWSPYATVSYGKQF